VEIAAVSSLYIQLDLTRKAQQDPLFAFRTTFEALTKVKPLGISLVSKSTAEIFLSSEQVTKAERSLPLNVLIPKPQLGEKDVRRRAASYNRGYFKILRRQSLEGLANHIQMKVLDLAEESIPNLPPGRRLAVSKAIKEDRLWVAEEDEDSDLMNNPYYGGF
jgi:vacuolar-type H+-ATPase subunit F/Vma7